MQKDKNNNDIFFALDIGTRSIMGILGEKDGENINIKNIAVELHKKRAMYDGQVHDIQAVADVAQIVKERLEQESGVKLTEVAIAAAGRSLKTIQTSITKKFEPDTMIDSQIMKNIEIECLQEAANILKENEHDNISYYNVGHTVMTYKLDDYEIKNPDGHKGEKLSLEVIATFLPKIVVEALDSVMQRIDLHISYMTLEPIVAIEVAIPENVRLLNIAMVDIGAGTSDVAITKDGTIVGYAMTSTAGDEITEALSQKFLLDFDTAETLKCNLCKSPNQEFVDIVGVKNEMTTEDILAQIDDSITLVANNISDAILKVNGKSTSAVFLIGGGSQIPGLTNKVAENLGLAESRVVIKTVESIPNVVNDNPLLEGPQSITPVGILACSIKHERKDFMEIKVNDKKVKLFRSAELKISDALILAGFNPRDLISRKGKSILVSVNGEKKMFTGTYGDEAIIYQNGASANIDSKINDNDTIVIEPAKAGNDAIVNVNDLLKDVIYVNDKEISYAYNVKINNISISDMNTQLANGDEIKYDLLNSTDRLSEYMNISNDKSIYVGDDLAKYDLSIHPNDKVRILQDKTEETTKKRGAYITITCNGEFLPVKSNKEQVIFVDIFDYIDFDRSKPQGILIMTVNGESAEFTTPLKNGDKVEVYWDN